MVKGVLDYQQIDPLDFYKVLWPDVRFFKQQQEIIYSVENNNETFVVAANQVGKDFVAAAIALRQFLCNREVRIITTSVKDDHLRVLWGEIDRFISTSKYPLLCERKRDKMLGVTQKTGGPLLVNHRDIRKIVDSKLCPISYLRGLVSEHAEGLQGHHAAYTLGIIDEATGVSNQVYDMMCTWAKRLLIFGNPMPVEATHFFYRGVKGGDIASVTGIRK